MVTWCVTYHYTDNPKDAAEFFSEATGPNGGSVMWWRPPPPPDAFLFGLAQKLEKRLRAVRYGLETLKLQTVVVAQDAGQNPINELKSGGCVADFWDRAAGATGPAPTGPQPNDLVEAGGTGWAWRSQRRTRSLSR